MTVINHEITRVNGGDSTHEKSLGRISLDLNSGRPYNCQWVPPALKRGGHEYYQLFKSLNIGLGHLTRARCSLYHIWQGQAMHIAAGRSGQVTGQPKLSLNGIWLTVGRNLFIRLLCHLPYPKSGNHTIMVDSILRALPGVFGNS